MEEQFDFSELENEQAVEQSAPEQETEKPSVQPEEFDPPVTPKKIEMSKARRIWRTFLIWLTVISLAYLAGILTMNYLRYRPILSELTGTYQSIADLEKQVSELSVKLTNAVEKADSLQEAKTHQQFLQVQVDIRNAQLALAQGDSAAALLALSGTTQKLDVLLPEIQAVDSAAALSMPQRLSLVISGLEDNIDNAAIDLGLFAADLQDLIDKIFEE